MIAGCRGAGRLAHAAAGRSSRLIIAMSRLDSMVSRRLQVLLDERSSRRFRGLRAAARPRRGTGAAGIASGAPEAGRRQTELKRSGRRGIPLPAPRSSRCWPRSKISTTFEVIRRLERPDVLIGADDASGAERLRRRVSSAASAFCDAEVCRRSFTATSRSAAAMRSAGLTRCVASWTTPAGRAGRRQRAKLVALGTERPLPATLIWPPWAPRRHSIASFDRGFDRYPGSRGFPEIPKNVT
jgi:hypothetical protein